MLGLKAFDLDFIRKVIHVRRSVDSRTKKEQTPKSKGRALDSCFANLESRAKRVDQPHSEEGEVVFISCCDGQSVYASSCSNHCIFQEVV